MLNHWYVNAKTQEERDVLAALSPGAWVHINLVGYYRFRGLVVGRLIDPLLSRWNWQEALKLDRKREIENSNESKS